MKTLRRAFFLVAFALSAATSFAQQLIPIYRFTVDYINFGGNSVFRSKQRVVGDYKRNADGTVEWFNVTVANSSTIDGAFGAADSQAFMNGFRYRPLREDITKPEFFKGFPANVTPMQNLVWDTEMFEGFANELGKVGNTPYRIPPSDVPLAGSGSFQNKNVELSRTGTAKRDGVELVVLHFDAFFNSFNLNLAGGMTLTGRSDYWGDIWVDPKTNTVERGTLNEEVLGEVRIPSQSNPQLINVVRRGTFEELGR